VRIGLQGGLDLTNIDYGVGGFGDPEVSQFRVGAAMIWKYVSATWLLLTLVLVALKEQGRMVIAAFMVSYAVRAATVAWMLFVGRTSFWTATRTMSEIPSALIVSIVAALLLWVTLWRKKGISEFEAGSERARI